MRTIYDTHGRPLRVERSADGSQLTVQTTPSYTRHLDRAGVHQLLAVIASSPGFRHEMRNALAVYQVQASGRLELRSWLRARPTASCSTEGVRLPVRRRRAAAPKDAGQRDIPGGPGAGVCLPWARPTSSSSTRPPRTASAWAAGDVAPPKDFRRDRHRHTSPPRRRRSRVLSPHGAWDPPGAAAGHFRLDLVT